MADCPEGGALARLHQCPYNQGDRRPGFMNTTGLFRRAARGGATWRRRAAGSLLSPSNHLFFRLPSFYTDTYFLEEL